MATTNQSSTKEVSSTEYFQLGDNQVQKVELHSSFQPEKGLTRDKHLDTMYHDFTANSPNLFPISELISKFNIEQGAKLDKGFIQAIQA